MQCPMYFFACLKDTLNLSARYSPERRVGGCMRGWRSVAGTVVAAALLAAAAPRIAWGDVRTATHDDAPPEPRPFDLLA